MVIRSWHSRAHSLLSSARRAQPRRSAQPHTVHPCRAWPEELSSARRGQLMQESSALTKEVSSCRRAQHCSKRSAHAGELSTAQRGQLNSAQEVSSSALTKEVSLALHNRSARPRELSFDQRGQFGQKSLSTAHLLRLFRVKRP